MAEPRLIFTIDVEEDMPGWCISDPVQVRNIAELPRLAELCAELGVKPTYLCTYPVVKGEESSATLKQLLERGDCEIGTHLHPWNTPPFNGVPGLHGDEREIPYYMNELGPDRFRSKLETLHEALTDLVGCPPTSFRAGRFGIDAATITSLAQQIKDVHDVGVEVEVVIGGGNIFRGVAVSSAGMDRASADYMGMLGTVINALALQDAVEHLGLASRVMTAFEVRAAAEPFVRRRALRLLEKGRVEGGPQASGGADRAGTEYTGCRLGAGCYGSGGYTVGYYEHHHCRDCGGYRGG